MIVTVKIFAASRPYAGREALPLELPEGAQIADLVRVLREQFGNLLEGEGITFLVNQQPATQETVLFDGDTVLVLRPLSGG